MNPKQRDEMLKTIKSEVLYFITAMLTLPWLVVTSGYLVVTAIFFLIQTSPLVLLNDLLPGDFGKFFTYSGLWILLTGITFSTSVLYHYFHRSNRVWGVVFVFLLVFLFIGYLIALWPEVDLYVRLR